MNDFAIEVINLKKEYVVSSGFKERTLRGSLLEKINLFKKKSVNKSFLALDDINFKLERGSVLGVIGSNGAGKSTLLKVLSRITEPTEGRVILRGRVSSMLEVGTGFHPELSGRENVFLNGSIMGMSRAEIQKVFDEIIDFAGVNDFVDIPVKRYSSGMYMRLAFAVAAHLNAEILIVDEVLAVGDAEFQNKCIGKMRSISTHGDRTVLFVSHNMSSIQALCNRCILLKNGKLVADGGTADVIQSYLQLSSSQNYFERDPSLDGTPKITKGEMHLKNDNKIVQVLLDLTIYSRIQTTIAVNVILHDLVGNPIAFGSIGFLNNRIIDTKDEGEYKIKTGFNCRGFASGKYYITLTVMKIKSIEIDHIDLCEKVFSFENISSLEEGQTRMIDQSWRSGSIRLDLF